MLSFKIGFYCKKVFAIDDAHKYLNNACNASDIAHFEQSHTLFDQKL